MCGSRTIISGCGISWSGQERPTWVKILKTLGADIVDLGGPAVTNEWILDRSALAVLQDRSVGRVIIQLTGLGKLDVEINNTERQQLVASDPVRNFTVDGIWPSSHSDIHISKKMWYQWLYSPGIEIQGLRARLKLLRAYCQHQQIDLVVTQGYHIPWSEHSGDDVLDMIDNHSMPLYDQYRCSEHYAYHDHKESNLVPELGWQLAVADSMSRRFWPDLQPRVQKMTGAFHARREKE